jgi:hypothetical protein
MDPPLPRLPPIIDNNHVSDKVAVASSDSAYRPSTSRISAADAIFGSSPHEACVLFEALLSNGSPDEHGKIWVASGRNISECDQTGALNDNVGDENEVSAYGVLVTPDR